MRKSIGAETTFEQDITSQDAAVLSRVAARIIESKLEPGKSVGLLGLGTDQLISEGDKQVYAVPLFDDLV